MPDSEAKIEQDIQLAASEAGHRLFRNNVGAYQDDYGRWIKYGVGGKGGSDEIGWSRLTITQDMVGRSLAVFTAIEVKTPTGRVSPEQTDWLASVARGGGISGVARSAEQAIEIMQKGPNKWAL